MPTLRQVLVITTTKEICFREDVTYGYRSRGGRNVKSSFGKGGRVQNED